MMMPFFIRNWAGAIGGRWAGPRLLDGLNWRMLDRLGSRSADSIRSTPLMMTRLKGVGEGFARGHSDGLQAGCRRAWGRTDAAAD